VGSRIVKGALGALVGGAAVGGAARMASKHTRRPRVLGIPIPEELNPKNLHLNLDAKKLAKSIDVKHMLKQIGNAAEQIEARSEDVRTVSGQAKRLTRKLS
jgi:hypothetical protein